MVCQCQSDVCHYLYDVYLSTTGYANRCMAFCRGLAGRQIGNFYRDVVRIITRVLIPLSFLVGLFLVSQGTPQTLGGNLTVHTIEGKLQDIAVGPVAALESIKHLGYQRRRFLRGELNNAFENPYHSF